MDRDGTRSGYDIDLLKAVGSAVNIPVIASGGVGCIKDLIDGATEGGASAVLAASIFHFGESSIKQAKEEMASAGISIRF
jgi:cyclase